jgi:hypothetical protein
MRYFPPPTPLALYSGFAPDECERRLREAIDVEKPATFTFSGYRGSKSFLGEVDGKHFRVLQRNYSGRNSFPLVLTGEFQPQGSGTQVKGILDLELTSKIAIGVFAIFGFLILIPIVISSHTSHPVLSVVFGCAYGSLSLFAPRIYRGTGQDREKRIMNFLKVTLGAE